MSYDSSGNMTYQRDNFKDLTKTITVDSQNRITQVQDALSTTIGNYWYDEGGFRVRRKALVPSGASFKNQEILYPSKFYGLEYSEETNILSSINNVYLNGVRIAALNEDGVTAYFLTDQVDSVAHVLDEGAHTLSRMQYEPYGETLVQRGTLDFAPKYNSQELDRETNFYFYNARYYDPQIARFTSADSVIDGSEDTQGWNRFAYVKGNPIRYKDPTGHCVGPVLVICAAAPYVSSALLTVGTAIVLYEHTQPKDDTKPIAIPIADSVADKDKLKPEVYYRTMTVKHFARLPREKIVPSRETFITEDESYARKLNGVTVRFEVAPGTKAALMSIGARANQDDLAKKCLTC